MGVLLREGEPPHWFHSVVTAVSGFAAAAVEQASNTRPTANMPEKTMPMTASSFTRLFSLMKPVATAQNNPATSAPIASGIPITTATASPGSTAWETASPISDQPFRIRKQEKIEQTVAISTDMSKARCMKS